MKDLEQTGAALEADIVHDNLKDVITELLQFTLAQLGESAPIVSTVFKAFKGVSAYRDFQLMNKVTMFLTELNKLSAKERKKLVDKMNDDPIYGQKAGTFILSALDRLDFEQKSVYLAKACKHYNDGLLSKKNLCEVKMVIERLSIYDLEKLSGDINLKFIPNRHDGSFLSFLNNGLITDTIDFAMLSELISSNTHSKMLDVDNERLSVITFSDLGEIVTAVFKDHKEMLKYYIDQDTDELRFSVKPLKFK